MMTALFGLAEPPLPMREAPNVELVEYDTRYVVKADVHAAGETGVALDLGPGVLIITGADEMYDTVCGSPHAFRYLLGLPEDVDESSVDFEYEGRVLTVTFGRL